MVADAQTLFLWFKDKKDAVTNSDDDEGDGEGDGEDDSGEGYGSEGDYSGDNEDVGAQKDDGHDGDGSELVDETDDILLWSTIQQITNITVQVRIAREGSQMWQYSVHSFNHSFNIFYKSNEC